ncbi:MAG: PaaI family thioesterase [Acidimicrobiales bacterium]
MRPLTNEAWGFSSNCFVCEPTNDRGLRIPFFHDEEAGAVRAEISLGPAFSGAPRYLHGGVVLAVLDEAMAWAAIALAARFAVTRTTTATFEHPVRVGQPYRVEAHIEALVDQEIRASAEVMDADGRCCAKAQAALVPLGPAQAADAVGEEVSGEASRLLCPPGPAGTGA